MKPPEEAKRHLVTQWLAKADEDLAAAHHLLLANPPPLGLVGFLAQQAAEKFLKAFLVWIQIPFPKTHDIEVLLKLVSRSNAALAEQLSETIGLTDFAVEARYPGNLPALTRQEAEAAIALAEETNRAVRPALRDAGM
jgi:HEPN domain-containing protein